MMEEEIRNIASARPKEDPECRTTLPSPRTALWEAFFKGERARHEMRDYGMMTCATMSQNPLDSVEMPHSITHRPLQAKKYP